jgi:hypothetical protein
MVVPKYVLLALSCVCFCPWVTFSPSKGEQPPQRARLEAVRRGMTLEEVRPLVGQPKQISRQILFRRHLEQWQFDDQAGWIDWNSVRGEPPYVLNSQIVKAE